MQPEFTEYSKQVIENAKAMAEVFNESKHVHVVSGGTDNHLMTIDISDTDLNGKQLQNLLDSVNITANKESIPNEPLSPFITSGLRIGTPAITSRGFNTDDSKKVARLILQVIEHGQDEQELKAVAKQVHELTNTHPIK